MSDVAIVSAQTRATLARARLSDSLGELKTRLLPSTLARQAARGIADKGSEVAQAGADAVKAQPAIAVGAAALVGLFLARKPIKRVIAGADNSTGLQDNRETSASAARSADRPDRKAKS